MTKLWKIIVPPIVGVLTIFLLMLGMDFILYGISNNNNVTIFFVFILPSFLILLIFQTILILPIWEWNRVKKPLIQFFIIFIILLSFFAFIIYKTLAFDFYGYLFLIIYIALYLKINIQVLRFISKNNADTE